MSTPTAARLAAVIDELFGLPADALTTDVALQEDLRLDSLSVIELQVAVEDAFDVRFAAADTSDVVTFGDLVDAVDAAMHRQRTAS